MFWVLIEIQIRKNYCLGPCSLAVPVLACGFMLFVVLCPGTPEGSTGIGSGFKASQNTGQRLKASSDRLAEAGNRTCDPWFTRHRFIPYTTAASLGKMSNFFRKIKTAILQSLYNKLWYYTDLVILRKWLPNFFTIEIYKGIIGK